MIAELLRYSNEGEWIRAQVSAFKCSIENAVKNGSKRFHACLSGGRTPEPIYAALAADSTLLELSAVIDLHFWIGDERDLPGGHPDRNDTMIRQKLAGVVEGSHFHHWPFLEREAACRAYSAELQAELGPEPVFDFCFLGIGSDGHTAGIFNLSDAAAPGGSLAHASESPLYPEHRMTIAAWVLRRSSIIVVGLRGTDKEEALEAALGGSSSPIGLVAGDRGIFYYLDSDRRA